MGTFDTKTIPYDLRFTDAAAEGADWFSSSGPYEVGDRLSTPYGDFRFRVEHRDQGRDVLTCAPFLELDAGPQTVEFSIPPQFHPTTISNRDAYRLIDEIQKLDPNATIAVKDHGRNAARQLRRRIPTLTIGDDEPRARRARSTRADRRLPLPLRRLQRDLRKKIDAET